MINNIVLEQQQCFCFYFSTITGRTYGNLYIGYLHTEQPHIMYLYSMTDFSLHLSTDETNGSIYFIFLSIYNMHNIQLFLL